MFNKFLNSIVISAVMLPSAAFAGEIGVSHSALNSFRTGVGELNVKSTKHIQVNEQSLSFSGQLSNSEYLYMQDGFSNNGISDWIYKDQGNVSDKPNSGSLALGGIHGLGEVGQLSASLAKRTLSSTERINSNLSEKYSFSDSVFTQTSSTFSR